MESNNYEHQLFRAVKALKTLAVKAYWDGHSSSRHCGSVFNVDTCHTCYHYDVCESISVLDDALQALKELEVSNAYQI